MLRLSLILLIAGGVVGVTIVRRLPEFAEALGPAVLYVIGGLSVAVLIIRFILAVTGERLGPRS